MTGFGGVTCVSTFAQSRIPSRLQPTQRTLTYQKAALGDSSAPSSESLLSILELPRPDFLRFRKLAIAGILATDMVRAL